jgi:hypothetical protein
MARRTQVFIQPILLDENVTDPIEAVKQAEQAKCASVQDVSLPWVAPDRTGFWWIEGVGRRKIRWYSRPAAGSFKCYHPFSKVVIHVVELPLENV